MADSKNSHSGTDSQDVIDPVCGMMVSGLSGIIPFQFDKKEFVFCSDYCKGRFLKNPSKYQEQPLVELRNAWKTFTLGTVKVDALRGLSIRIWKGDYTAIIGASGSGKSTALNIIGLLDRPTSGKVFLNGQDVGNLSEDEKAALRSKTFGFVFQQYNLIPWLSAFDNVALPLIFSKLGVEESRVAKIFNDVDLKERMRHRPTELSGGEQQRVSLARALVNDPAIILADEPTGNLDSVTGHKIFELLRTLQKVYKKTLIVVTHDRDIAAKADQILVLKDGSLARDHYIKLEELTE